MNARIAAFVAALAILIGGFVLSELTHRQRKARGVLTKKLLSKERYVDLAVRLKVVKTDIEGEVLIDGCPPMKVLREHIRGGRYDTLTRKFTGPAHSMVTLFCSEQQERAILHDAADPAGMWLQSGMGAGKTSAGCVWLTLQIIKHAERNLKGAGVTSPVGRRMEAIRKILFGSKNADGQRVGGIWPGSWFTWREGDQVAVLRTGLSIDFVSAHVSSEAEGSPIQGQNWSLHLADELQDYYEADADIQMRGRAALGGRYERLATVTPKRDSGYRAFRDQIAASVDWLVVNLSGLESPFVSAAFWEARSRALTKEQYQRAVLGLDPPSDFRVYTEFDRAETIRPLPQVPRWPDVTRRELARWGNYEMLVGFDPGRIFDVSVLLKAYQPPIPAATRSNPRPSLPDPVWFVVGEVTTKRSTTDRHCVALLKELRDRWGLNAGSSTGQALVRGDPTTKTGTDEENPDRNVYRVFDQFGIAIKAAVYKPGSTDHGRVPKNGRIDLINTLLCNYLGERRLFIACNDRGEPSAPKLVESFERQELDHNGKAEMAAKDEHDLTHWACAVGYALWSIESSRLAARVA